MVVRILVPFWIPIIIRHLIFRVPKRDHNFDNHPQIFSIWEQTQLLLAISCRINATGTSGASHEAVSQQLLLVERRKKPHASGLMGKGAWSEF